MLLTVSAFGNRRTALSTIAASFLEDWISSNGFTGIGVKPRSPLVTASKKPCRSSRSTAPRLLDLRTSPCGGRRGALLSSFVIYAPGVDSQFPGHVILCLEMLFFCHPSTAFFALDSGSRSGESSCDNGVGYFWGCRVLSSTGPPVSSHVAQRQGLLTLRTEPTLTSLARLEVVRQSSLSEKLSLHFGHL